MTLHNYWWLLIWLFLFGSVSALFIPKQEEYVLGKKETRWHWLPALILVLPYVIWAAWRPYSLGDTAAYGYGFLAAPSSLSQLGSYVASQSKDRGYAVLVLLFKALVSRSDIAFFFFMAACQMACLMLTYRKYSSDFWLSMFMFVASADYLSWFHNGMRQFICAAILFACLPLLLRKRYLILVVITVILSQIHLSTLIFLPFIFIVNGKAWNIKTIIFILLVIVSTLFIDRITGFITDAMEDTAYSGDIYHFINDDGSNIFRVLFYSVPTVLAFVFRRQINAADDPLINICVNLSVVSAGFYVISYFTSGILIGRIPIFFSLANYILIPWMVKAIFTSKSAIAMKLIIVGAYSLFFYYQVGVAWELF